MFPASLIVIILHISIFRRYLLRIWELSSNIWLCKPNSSTKLWRKLHRYVQIVITIYIPLKIIPFNCRRRDAKFKPMLGAYGLWAGRDLYRATHVHAVTLVFAVPFTHVVAINNKQGILMNFVTNAFMQLKYWRFNPTRVGPHRRNACYMHPTKKNQMEIFCKHYC